MSTTLQADTSNPAFTADEYPRLLAGLVLAYPADRSVLTVLGIGSILVQAHAGRALAYPRIALQLDEVLIACFKSQGGIYPLRHAHVADDFYIEYIPERRTLWLKFQTLFGSRLLMAMTPAQANEFEQTIRGLCPGASQPAAETGDTAVLEEIGLLAVRGQRLELPAQRLAHYVRIKALVQAAGGRYARNGFAFPAGCDVPALLAQLSAGGRPNPKKERQPLVQGLARPQHVGLEIV